MARRFTFLLVLGIVAIMARGAEFAVSSWSRVDVAPTKTSIYVGTVSMTTPTFVRTEQTYSADYIAKVFPFFFYNEKGRLTVNVTDEQLDQLTHGQTIEFDGRAIRTDGATRFVKAKATPTDARTGALVVHVYLSKRIDLIFHTTYQFPSSRQ